MTDKEIERRRKEMSHVGMTEDEEKEYQELAVREMVNSCLCYDGRVSTYDRNNFFTRADKVLGKDRVNEVITLQTDFFREHAEVRRNIYTDSEGCSYNGIQWK